MQGLGGVGADTGAHAELLLVYYSCRGFGTGLGLAGAALMFHLGQDRRLTVWGSFWGDLLPSWKLSDLGGSI